MQMKCLYLVKNVILEQFVHTVFVYILKKLDWFYSVLSQYYVND